MKFKVLFAIIVILTMLMMPTAGFAAGINCCYDEETGWGNGLPYVPQGNWATYTPYYGYAQNVTLYAGQTMEAGRIHFSNPVDGMVTITIILRQDWTFDNVDEYGNEQESVHVQDYMDPPPPENPAPGQFAYTYVAAGRVFTFEVPQANFYGIHVALMHRIPCHPSFGIS